MATRQGRQNASGRSAYQRQTTYRDVFIEGNTVRNVDIRRKVQEVPEKRVIRGTRPEAHRMSVGYALFLVLAMLIAGAALINYVQMQFEVTDNVKEIAQLESQLITLTQSNDETYAKIVNNVDLEEVKKIAMGQLGMIYAEEGQIITYTDTGSDYVRQYQDIPQ
ncbi:MAG: cell division protein FtsL [Lachnospiraceae bacterium]|nr:cell division protein FtsL [Lachnospiraceae bacterium]